MFRRLRHLFDYLFRRRRLEDDLDEELQSSFNMIVDQFIARGMSAAEARRAARLEFEGLEQVKEKIRDGLIGSAIQVSLQDLRYAWRGLTLRPSFALIALITLALGIGVNTAVFSVFYAVLMRPLPYNHPRTTSPHMGQFPDTRHRAGIGFRRNLPRNRTAPALNECPCRHLGNTSADIPG
jgi:hypothetical protein